ncbi:MAG: BMP family ABC transporter substrate-binding protein [Chloroflexi bacterium]|nr:MAG: BMP family ABC transporter substrate-binding protein [Chloroflexota bacterium]
MPRKLVHVVMLLALVLSIVPVAVVSAQGDVSSVCLVTDVGRVNDGTFNQFAFDGMTRAVEDFNLDSTFIETQAPTDYESNIATCINEGFDIIVTVGFTLADATRAAAEANPDRWFIVVDTDFAEPLPNLVGLQFRDDQAGFMAGVLAALMSESGTVAGIYGIAIPPVVRFRHGYEQGVAYANATFGTDVEVLGVYIDDFQAPDRGASAAEQFIGEGADVIFGAGGPTGSGGILRASQEGIKVIGVDQDEYFTTFGGGETPGAENLISSAIKRVDIGVYDMIAAVVNGEGFPENSVHIVEAANQGIDIAPPHDADVPQEVLDILQMIKAQLESGELETGVDPNTAEIVAPPGPPAAVPEATEEVSG